MGKNAVKLLGARVWLALAHFYGQNNVFIAHVWPHVAQGSARSVVLSIATSLCYVTVPDRQSYTVYVILSLNDTSRTRRLDLPDQLSVSPENANHTDKKFPIYVTRWSINTFPKHACSVVIWGDGEVVAVTSLRNTTESHAHTQSFITSV